MSNHDSYSGCFCRSPTGSQSQALGLASLDNPAGSILAYMHQYANVKTKKDQAGGPTAVVLPVAGRMPGRKAVQGARRPNTAPHPDESGSMLRATKRWRRGRVLFRRFVRCFPAPCGSSRGIPRRGPATSLSAASCEGRSHNSRTRKCSPASIARPDPGGRCRGHAPDGRKRRLRLLRRKRASSYALTTRYMLEPTLAATDLPPTDSVPGNDFFRDDEW